MKSLMNVLTSSLVLVVILSACSPLYSQSLLEKAGGIPTSFIIKSDSIILNNTQQYLVEKDNIIPANEFQSIVYQSYHLEFVSEQELTNPYKFFERKYFLTLLDNQGNTLTRLQLSSGDVYHLSNNKIRPELHLYSINMDKIPLIVLDQTHTIEIVQHGKS